MFSHLLSARLKAAEKALRDGRLDEAYRLATARDIREHRRGAAVLTALTEKFIERARNHYRADRFTEALMDLDRAERGGVLKEEIAELRGHVHTVVTEQRRREQSQRERLEAVRRRVEGGSLAAGKKILEQASENDHTARELRREVEERAVDAGRIVEQAEKLIGQGRLAAAADRLRRAKAIDAHGEEVTRVENRLCDRVLENARAAIDQGRLARAADELGCLKTLGEHLPARRELSSILAIARQGAQCLRAHAYTDAQRHAMSLARLLPKAAWIEAVVDQLRQIADIETALAAGPLGDRTADGAAQADAVPRADGPGSLAIEPGGQSPPVNLDDTVALPNRVRTRGDLPERLLLLIDGGGSYLLLRSDRASVGRVASKSPADVPIFSDVAERHANITRVEDDYFIFSAKDVEVGGRKTQHHLLRDGDRVVLGRKAKLTFRLPSRKSPTAVLDLSDTTKMPNDVRRVVLFHRHAAVGAGANAHIHCRHAGAPLVLYERDGALWMRQKNDGHADTDPVRLPLGQPVEIAGVSLVLEPWEIQSSRGGQV